MSCIIITLVIDNKNNSNFAKEQRDLGAIIIHEMKQRWLVRNEKERELKYWLKQKLLNVLEKNIKEK